MNQPPRRRGGALWGILGGAALIILYIMYRFILRAVNRRVGAHPRATTLLTTLQFGFFCLVIILLALLGFIAARLARRLEAGIAAGAIAGILIALVELGVAAIDAYHARRHGQPSLGSPLLTAARDFIALTLAGVGAGTIGGLASRGMAPEPPAFAPAAPAPFPDPYQGVPPAGSNPSLPPSPDDYSTAPPLQ